MLTRVHPLDTYAERLQALQATSRFRTLRTVRPTSPTRAIIDGKERLLFSTNDYLGLAQDERLCHASQEAILTYGVGARSARLIAGTTDLHTQLEQELASWKQGERALVFTAGYLANIGTISALVARGDCVIVDKLAHASLIDGARLSGATLRVFPHNDVTRLAIILKQHEGRFQKTLIVTESIFSMDGDYAPLEELVSIKERFGALLMVDEAHATGILGPTGAGLIEERELAGRVDVQMGTLSKALGGLGGYVVGSKLLIDYLVNHARSFVYATALPPAVCAAALRAIAIVKESNAERETLWAHVRVTRAGIQEMGFKLGASSSPIIPLMVGDDTRALTLAQALFEQGIFIPAIRPPTVREGTSRLRLTVSAAHTSADIQTLLRALRQARNAL